MATPASRAIFSNEASTRVRRTPSLPAGEELLAVLPGVTAQGPAHLLKPLSAQLLTLSTIPRAASVYLAARESKISVNSETSNLLKMRHPSGIG